MNKAVKRKLGQGSTWTGDHVQRTPSGADMDFDIDVAMRQVDSVESANPRAPSVSAGLSILEIRAVPSLPAVTKNNKIK